MKLQLTLILFVALISVSASSAVAQSDSAAQAAEDLRARLFDVQAKEAGLQNRARQLDEDLKPENIERSLAGIGSTRPEDLREFRRRQLTIERDGVRAQLKILATSRERLESAIRTADGEAYQQSAEGPLTEFLRAPERISPVGAAAMLVGLLAIFGTLVVTGLVRRFGLPVRETNRQET